MRVLICSRAWARVATILVVMPRAATAGMTCFALLSILAMYLGRETKNDPLPLFEVGSAAKEPSR